MTTDAGVLVEESSAERISLKERVLSGGLVTFSLFVIAGTALLVFLLLTVQHRSGEELQKSAARRSFNTISWWNDHGYFASGGLINLVSPQGSTTVRAFYRSSTGAYMVSGYLVEKIAILMTGTYRWRLLAIHNSIVTMLTAALIALFVYRLLIRIDVTRRYAVAFALATLAVYMTFPDILAQYWEISPHAEAVPFAILFLLADEEQVSSLTWRIVQMAAAFAVVYVEFIFGTFFLMSYCAITVLTEASRDRVRDLIFKAALPALTAILLFQAQLSWVRFEYPEVPFTGSEFMFRTGFDGSTVYYHGHSDIIYARRVARTNFPANKDFLFSWPTLFFAGLAAAAFVVGLAAVNARLRSFLALLPLLGGYALYAALFSQAVVIHPYYYDILIATPLIMAVFAFAPAIVEMRLHTRGVITFVTLFAAAWYSMVQMRDYAMWYPMQEPPVVKRVAPPKPSVPPPAAAAQKTPATR